MIGGCGHHGGMQEKVMWGNVGHVMPRDLQVLWDSFNRYAVMTVGHAKCNQMTQLIKKKKESWVLKRKSKIIKMSLVYIERLEDGKYCYEL